MNSFLNNLKKKIDGEDEDDVPPAQPPRPGTQGYGIRRSGEAPRRSADRDRYDADPQILGDDFAAIHMHDETGKPLLSSTRDYTLIDRCPESQRRSPRPQAHPDLFKPTPNPPSSEKKVSFSDVRSDSKDNPNQGAPDATTRSPSANARSKWQPLSAVAPNPVGDHDPFSLGDSDEEDAKRHDAKDGEKALPDTTHDSDANKPIKLTDGAEETAGVESKDTGAKPA